MLKGLVFLFTLLFCAALVKGQSRVMDALSDTVAYKANIAGLSEFGLQDLSISPHKKHWRFFADQIVDIWSDDDSVYYGSVLTYMYNIDKKRAVVTRTEAIDKVRSKNLMMLFRRLQIDTISSDNNIAGWNYQIGDGETVIVAYSDAYICSYKKYFCPGLQLVNQAKVISDFFSKLSTTLDLSKKQISFIHELPLGRYSLGMMIIEKTDHMRAKGGSIWGF